VTYLNVLSKYLLIMELRFDAMLCSNVGNGKSDAGHIKCSCGRQVHHPRAKQKIFFSFSKTFVVAFL